jgi:hypothetical protein
MLHTCVYPEGRDLKAFLVNDDRQRALQRARGMVIQATP